MTFDPGLFAGWLVLAGLLGGWLWKLGRMWKTWNDSRERAEQEAKSLAAEENRKRRDEFQALVSTIEDVKEGQHVGTTAMAAHVLEDNRRFEAIMTDLAYLRGRKDESDGAPA